MMRKHVGTLLALVLLAASAAQAAPPDAGIPKGSGPGGVPFGAGTQRGIAGVNNSGQSGFVTTFGRGPRTGVVVQIDGAGSAPERVAIERSGSCDRRGAVLVQLTALHGGSSRGYVSYPQKQLMSGRYSVVVLRGTRPVACGELTPD